MNEFEMPDTERPASERGVERVLALFEELYEAAVDDILSRMDVVAVKRYGAHEIRKFRDGRVQCLSRRRWDGDREQPMGPTPYELLQLGEDPRPLYPVRLSLWQQAGLGLLPAIVGGFLPALGWATRRFRGRLR